MINFKLLVLVYLLIFQFTIIAQTNSLSNSSDFVKNSGLMFENEMKYGFEDSSYTTTIQLLSLSKKAQALQFRLLFNKASDDNTILIFNDIQKGSDITDPSWLMEFNVIKGPTEKNGASQDVVFVLLYSQNLDGGLLPGDYNNLFTIDYSIADFPELQNDIKTSLQISEAQASTSDGNAIDITSNHNELKIIVKGE